MRLPTIFLTLVAQSLFAQEDKVSVRFVSFPEMTKTPKLEVMIGEGKTIKVELPSHVLSKTYKLPATSSWQLGENLESEDGKSAFKSYGTVKAGSASSQLVLVMFKGKDASAGLSSLSFDDKSFKGGNFLIFNFTKQEAAAEVGSERFKLKPAGHKIINPKANRGKNLCFASLLAKQGTEWRPFFSSNWPIDPNSRGLVFLYQKPGRRVPSLHTIVDNL